MVRWPSGAMIVMSVATLFGVIGIDCPSVKVLSEGIGVLPFIIPGTPEQGETTAQAMRRHRLVVWSQHGVVARSDRGPAAAVDLIDYVETVAGYEALDIAAGRPAVGLTLAQLRQIAERFGVASELLNRLPDELLGSLA